MKLGIFLLVLGSLVLLLLGIAPMVNTILQGNTDAFYLGESLGFGMGLSAAPLLYGVIRVRNARRVSNVTKENSSQN